MPVVASSCLSAPGILMFSIDMMAATLSLPVIWDQLKAGCPRHTQLVLYLRLTSSCTIASVERISLENRGDSGYGLRDSSP